MSNFLDIIEDKIAFKKALKQLDEEQATKRSSVTRVYHNTAFSAPQKETISHFVSDDAVDTNYFKEWREEVILEPGNHETIIETKRANYDEEDKENQTSNKGSSFIDILDSKNDLKRDINQDFSDFKSYLQNRQKSIKEEVAQSSVKEDIDMNFVQPTVIKQKKDEILLGSQDNQQQNEKDRQEIKDKLDEILKSITENKNNNIDADAAISEKKTNTTAKLAIKKKGATEPNKVISKKTSVKSTEAPRKTRGKAKRKLDSDIVKIVDWRD